MTDEQKTAARTIAALMKQHFDSDLTDFIINQIDQVFGVENDDPFVVDEEDGPCAEALDQAGYLSNCLEFDDVDGAEWGVRYADGWAATFGEFDDRTNDADKIRRWVSKTAAAEYLATAARFTDATGGEVVRLD